MLSNVKHFADLNGYDTQLLWGMTSGVSFCRFEELFSPIPGISVTNLLPNQLWELMQRMRSNRGLRVGKKNYEIFRPSLKPKTDFFCWDIRDSFALKHLSPTPALLITVRPSAPLRREVAGFVHKNRLTERLGIRIRVEENIARTRKPRRIARELDAVLKSIARIPWYVRVFVASDSEYMQQMIASHFPDTVYWPKEFDLQEKTGRYVHRQDKNAMRTFVREVECLCQCRMIINVAGFLNDHAVRDRTISEPYLEAAHLPLIRRGD
jgi:hypothetical protein